MRGDGRRIIFGFLGSWEVGIVLVVLGENVRVLERNAVMGDVLVWVWGDYLEEGRWF